MNNKINSLLLATEMMKMKLREASDDKKLVFEDDADDLMAVTIEGINKAEHCSVCVFSERIDNFHTICSLKPFESPIKDTDPIADYCPVKGNSKNCFVPSKLNKY